MVSRRIIKEPLLHFLIAGVVIFAAYSVMDRSPASEDKSSIEVGNGQLAQLFETFSRTWQRPPTETELNDLIDGYVKEEVFYREGLEMGLDQNDAIVRRRMQQKLEFLLDQVQKNFRRPATSWLPTSRRTPEGTISPRSFPSIRYSSTAGDLAMIASWQPGRRSPVL